METFDPTVARLRRVLELTAAGRTQSDIAALMNCEERTVRRLLKTAREREVSTFRGLSAEALLADISTKADTHYRRWTHLWARAQKAGDLRAEALILARMDANLIGRVAMLARVGFFDNATFASHGATDEGTRKLEQGRKEIAFLVDLSVRTNRGEDISTIEMEEPKDTSNLDDLYPLY